MEHQNQDDVWIIIDINRSLDDNKRRCLITGIFETETAARVAMLLDEDTERYGHNCRIIKAPDVLAEELLSSDIEAEDIYYSRW